MRLWSNQGKPPRLGHMLRTARFLAAIHSVERCIKTRTGGRSLSSGLSTALVTPGLAVAQRAPTPIRAAQMPLEKCCGSSGNIHIPRQPRAFSRRNGPVPRRRTTACGIQPQKFIEAQGQTFLTQKARAASEGGIGERTTYPDRKGTVASARIHLSNSPNTSLLALPRNNCTVIAWTNGNRDGDVTPWRCALRCDGEL